MDRELISVGCRRPGYIAGVCNPAFADRPSWWDVLCNIETGKITISKDLRPPAPSNHNHTSKGTRIDGGAEDGGKEKDKEKGDKGDSPDNIFMEEVRLFTAACSLIDLARS